MDSHPTFGVVTGLATVAILGLLAHMLTKASSHSQSPLPPGPKPLPLIGNLLDFPRHKEWLVYYQWAQRYGDIVHLEALGQHTVVLNSAKAANDLLERRSTIYSGRPTNYMLNKLRVSMGLEDWNFGIMTYGDAWRKTRRVFHSQMHSNVAPRFQSVQKRQTRAFLKQLLEDPTDLTVSVRGAVGATIVDVVYGIKVAGAADQYITLAEEMNKMTATALLPGAFLVDLIPLLSYVPGWFPGAEFQRFAAQSRRLTEKVVEEPMQEVERDMVSGNAKVSMTSELLDQSQSQQEQQGYRTIVRNASSVAYGAGADTTVSSLLTFFIAMANYPKVQAKAQAQLDSVVGQDRLPEFSDWVKLPYITAIISEVFRWQPVTPLGLPHATTADDEYKGYFIPKSTIVMVNIWAILHDPKEYPNPEEFRPERFLKDGALFKDVRDPRTAFFGFGRRICPGRHLAEQSLFIMIASILSAFSIAPPVDENGNSVPCKLEMSSGLGSHPAPFKCIVEPRSPSATELVNQPLPPRGL